MSLKSRDLRMSLSRDIKVRWFSLSCNIDERILFLTKDSLEKERSPLALVTGKVKKIRRAMSTSGNTDCRFSFSGAEARQQHFCFPLFFVKFLNWAISSGKSSCKSVFFFLKTQSIRTQFFGGDCMHIAQKSKTLLKIFI